MPEGAIVVCTWGTEPALPGLVAQALTLCRGVSGAMAAPLGCLLLGPAPEAWTADAARFGAEFVDRITSEALGRFMADLYVEALAQYCRQRRPRVLVFGQTFDARVVAPRLAGRLGCGVVMNGVEMESDGADGRLRVTATGFGTATRSVYRFGPTDPQIVAIAAGAVVEAVEAAAAPVVTEVAVDLSHVRERVCVVEPARRSGPRLEEARIIVAGGRGLGGPENYALVEQLAEALGGMPAASRPIVDDGWTSPDRWVGLTGKVVNPDLYIAAGISGASQHMAGCSGARALVAINSDADAGIFRYARYGIVGDCTQILPELTRLAAERTTAAGPEPGRGE